MPRKVRNPGSGKAPVNTPAQGAGWGGPAKGASTAPASIQTAPPVGPETNPSGLMGDRKAQRRERAMAILDAAMEEGDSWQVRVMAADKMLDRIEGKPTQKIVTPESGPEWFIAGVPEAEDMDAWQDQARLATAKPAGHAD